MSLFNKNNEEPKIDISKLKQYLIKASEARFLDWKPTGNRVRIDERVYLGYKTKLPSGLSMEIVPHLIGNEMISSLIIKGGTEELFLTEDPKKLPGKEVTDSTDLLIIALRINEIFENKNLINSIESELAGFLYSE